MKNITYRYNKLLLIVIGAANIYISFINYSTGISNKGNINLPLDTELRNLTVPFNLLIIVSFIPIFCRVLVSYYQKSKIVAS